jgi:hypothetical protein
MACGYHSYLNLSSTHDYLTHIPFAHLTDLNITLKDPRNAFGQLTYANIALRAPLVSCHWNPGTHHDVGYGIPTSVSWLQPETFIRHGEGFDLYQGQMFLHVAPTHLEIGLYGFVFDALDDLNGEQEDIVIVLLNLVFGPPAKVGHYNRSVYALILKKLSNDRRSHYRRVGGGRFIANGDTLPHFQALPLEDIVIV